MKRFMSRTDRTDRQFCWEQVLRVRPEFRLTQPYSRQLAWLLPLYALFSALEEGQNRSSDPFVARAKLAWWRDELLSAGYRSSEHPICRQLSESGFVLSGLEAVIEGWVKSFVDRLDALAPVDEHQLRALCVTVGLYPTLLELGTQQHPRPGSFLDAACAVNGLVQLLRESGRSRNEMERFTWVPLTLLAHHSLSRSDLYLENQSGKSWHLFAQLAQLAESWMSPFGRWRAVIEQERSEGELWFRANGSRHWFIQACLQKRLLGKMSTSGASHPVRVLTNPGMSDVGFVWLCARQFSQGRKGR